MAVNGDLADEPHKTSDIDSGLWLTILSSYHSSTLRAVGIIGDNRVHQ